VPPLVIAQIRPAFIAVWLAEDVAVGEAPKVSMDRPGTDSTTKAVVAIEVSLLVIGGVGAVGEPVKSGELAGARLGMALLRSAALRQPQEGQGYPKLETHTDGH
jgi:hypothetical protein